MGRRCCRYLDVEIRRSPRPDADAGASRRHTFRRKLSQSSAESYVHVTRSFSVGLSPSLSISKFNLSAASVSVTSAASHHVPTRDAAVVPSPYSPPLDHLRAVPPSPSPPSHPTRPRPSPTFSTSPQTSFLNRQAHLGPTHGVLDLLPPLPAIQHLHNPFSSHPRAKRSSSCQSPRTTADNGDHFARNNIRDAYTDGTPALPTRESGYTVPLRSIRSSATPRMSLVPEHP
jgi:hypothetical protein